MSDAVQVTRLDLVLNGGGDLKMEVEYPPSFRFEVSDLMDAMAKAELAFRDHVNELARTS